MLGGKQPNRTAIPLALLGIIVVLVLAWTARQLLGAAPAGMLLSATAIAISIFIYWRRQKSHHS
jgi:hypothetical protein